MTLPVVLALGSQLFTAVADEVPVLNVEPVCRGIVQQSGTTSGGTTPAQQKETCIKSEQTIRDVVAKQWSTFSAGDKTHCVNESKMGGESSYTELLTCLEMARDVRNMRNKPPDTPGVAAQPVAPAAPATTKKK